MFYFGADYYPEHLPEDCWAEDARLMQEAGFNVVRMAEFAWSLLEPRDGVFDFDWLDRAITILGERGIKTVLGTPTASTPPWLFKPEIAFVDANGNRRVLGSRREYCPTSAEYRRYAVRITRAMAEHYRNNPHIIGWQIDNEFGERCYCDQCRRAFQNWLKQRFDMLDAVNERWGTRFWSHVYTDWEQIPAPHGPIHGIWNPGLLLDYYRFMSDTYVEFQQLQVDALRELCPHHFITHNLMGFAYDQINYFDLAESLDFVSWDNYPRGFWINTPDINPAPMALGHDTMRSLKRRNFWVMEQQAGPAAWDRIPPSPRPGELRLWAYQGIAHGADGMVFFRWRTAHFGAEQYWHGIIDHDGIPRRRYAEIKNMGLELQRTGEQLVGAEVRSEAAIMLSYETRFAFQIQQNNPQFYYSSHVGSYYDALHCQNISTDFVAPHADLTPYKLVIVPALYVADEAAADNLRRFVENGGTLIVTPRSGVKEPSNTVVSLPLPGLLAGLCGVEVAEYDSLLAGQTRSLNFVLPEFTGNGEAAIWCDMLEPKGAQVAAVYTSDYYAGQPAVTVNDVGAGQTIYVGTMGDESLVQSVVQYAINKAGVRPLLQSPYGVEVTARWQGNRRLLFALNHTNETQSLSLDKVYRDLLSDQVLSGEITIPARQVLVLVENQA
jgi:beta-galactosidase